MKKKLLIFTLLFLLSPFLKVHSASMDSYIDWNLDRGVFAHQYRDGQDHITNLAMITANGKVAYCIEPGVVADKGSMYNSTYDINETNLKGVDVKKLSLIGYYGYGYEGHGDKRYYMATQELIWRLMGVDDVWWTDQKEGGNIINVDSYKNEILRLVNAYETAPKFEFKDAYIVGDEVVLEDMNNVLSGYEVTSGSASIDGNKINVSVDNKVNNFTLKRKSNGKYPIFYYKNGYQTIGSFESAYEYSKDYVINGKYAKIIVNKKDYDNKSNTSLSQYASLKGASYTLYDKEGNVLSVKETDERGIAIFDNLKKGTYVIKETNSSSGYNIDITRYETYVATSRMEAVINSYEKIINDFQQGKTDILIGTQMVSKGLDFDNVSVVGIVNADNMLNFPDFRSYERAFQLMEQVAGRAGRRNRQGLVVIQTGDPDNVVIKEVVAHDYEAMYESQCEERLMFKYPPFYRMVNVYLKHKDGLKISRMAEIMAGKMRQVFGARVLGPDRPPVGKIQNYHIRKIVLKVEGRLPLAYVRQELRRIRAEMKADAECRSAVVYYDVDPM